MGSAHYKKGELALPFFLYSLGYPHSLNGEYGPQQQAAGAASSVSSPSSSTTTSSFHFSSMHFLLYAG